MRAEHKFFTDPFYAKDCHAAFQEFLIELVRSELALPIDIDYLFEKGYIPALRLAQDDLTQFMFVKSVESLEHIVFSLYDEGGWRFFGRL